MGKLYKTILKLQQGGYTGTAWQGIQYMPKALPNVDPKLLAVTSPKLTTPKINELELDANGLYSDTALTQKEYNAAITGLTSLIAQYGEEATYTKEGQQFIQQANNATSAARKAELANNKKKWEEVNEIITTNDSNDRLMFGTGSSVNVFDFKEGEFTTISLAELALNEKMQDKEGNNVSRYQAPTLGWMANNREQTLAGLHTKVNVGANNSLDYNKLFSDADNVEGLQNANAEVEAFFKGIGNTDLPHVKEFLQKAEKFGLSFIQKMTEDTGTSTNYPALVKAARDAQKNLSDKAKNAYRQEELAYVMQDLEDGKVFQIIDGKADEVDISGMSDEEKKREITRSLEDRVDMRITSQLYRFLKTQKSDKKSFTLPSGDLFKSWGNFSAGGFEPEDVDPIVADVTQGVITQISSDDFDKMSNDATPVNAQLLQERFLVPSGWNKGIVDMQVTVAVKDEKGKVIEIKKVPAKMPVATTEKKDENQRAQIHVPLSNLFDTGRSALIFGKYYTAEDWKNINKGNSIAIVLPNSNAQYSVWGTMLDPSKPINNANQATEIKYTEQPVLIGFNTLQNMKGIAVTPISEAEVTEQAKQRKAGTTSTTPSKKYDPSKPDQYYEEVEVVNNMDRKGQGKQGELNKYIKTTYKEGEGYTIIEKKDIPEVFTQATGIPFDYEGGYLIDPLNLSPLRLTFDSKGLSPAQVALGNRITSYVNTEIYGSGEDKFVLVNGAKLTVTEQDVTQNKNTQGIDEFNLYRSLYRTNQQQTSQRLNQSQNAFRGATNQTK